MPDAQRTDRVRDELRRIAVIIEDITGLRSRWNETVELVPEADFKGKKPFSCTILLDAALADEEVHWRTWIHELLHAVSAGYVQSDYLTLLGWEEGVIEQLQRRMRPEVLTRLGVTVSEDIFSRAEVAHPYNRYIAALEQIRTVLEVSPETFYLDLLRTPIRDRTTFVFALGNSLPRDRRVAFMKLFSVSNSVLRG